MRVLAGIVPLHAWHRAQILVNRAEVASRKAFISWPWHDLQQIAVERGRDAAGVRSACAGRVQVVRILPRANRVQELRKRVAPNWTSAGVGRQVTGNDVRGPGNQRTEIPAASQIGCRIQMCWLPEVRIAAGRVLGLWAGLVTAVALAGHVDEIASQAYKFL